ncbi:VOC family protein [Mesorhizobium xinjiangense]|uniref:VOC family protein n=1 Tax=Mesorhizobium xinjiangense TaxID=2678685 RepID=UPI0012ED4D3E|nr:VOC family protein [Mesorhizobium xinjiangense]
MPLGRARKITDICLLVEDIERTVDFYVNKLDFRLRRKAEGFADFCSDGITLAAWELDHVNQHCGVSNRRAPVGAHKACVAMEIDRAEEIDRLYRELVARGVPVYAEPRDYVWNARCIYFSDPDDTLWELYAWIGAGPGDYHEEYRPDG